MGLAAYGCIQREVVAGDSERLGGAGGCSAHRIAQGQYFAACIRAENDPILERGAKCLLGFSVGGPKWTDDVQCRIIALCFAFLSFSSQRDQFCLRLYPFDEGLCITHLGLHGGAVYQRRNEPYVQYDFDVIEVRVYAP